MTYSVEDYLRALPKGWWDIARPVIKQLLDENIEIHQIKEKFASGRIYIGSAPDYIHDIIQNFEEKSATVCCDCGGPGTIRYDRSWYLCLCDTCNELDLSPADLYKKIEES
jgi:hypothetical protein